MLKALLLCAAAVLTVAPLFGQSQNEVKLSLPNHDWALVMNLPGFQMQSNDLGNDGTARRFVAEDIQNGMFITVYLERAAKPGDAGACRKYYWSKEERVPLPRSDVRMYNRGRMAVVEHMVFEYQGHRLDQKHMNAYMVEGDIWIDIHISMVQYRAEKQPKFDAILDSVKVDPTFKQTSMDYAGYGSFSY
jgi:hypothetical protein